MRFNLRLFNFTNKNDFSQSRGQTTEKDRISIVYLSTSDGLRKLNAGACDIASALATQDKLDALICQLVPAKR